MKKKINDFITLKLENNITNIYINNEIFNQCKFLIANLTKKINDIESIDELKDIITEQENRSYIIDPKTEFFGHCSNIEAWVEYNYDTRLLDSKLAFPMLKKLTECGDIKAKKIYREEIINRMLDGYITTVVYLCVGNYLDIFNIEELKIILEDLNINKKTSGIYFAISYIYKLLMEKDTKLNNIEIIIDNIVKCINTSDNKLLEKRKIFYILYRSLNINLDSIKLKFIYNKLNINGVISDVIKSKISTDIIKKRNREWLIEKLRNKQLNKK